MHTKCIANLNSIISISLTFNWLYCRILICKCDLVNYYVRMVEIMDFSLQQGYHITDCELAPFVVSNILCELQ